MAVREGLLALLEEAPRHGYQLKTSFEEATGGVWPLNVGQVYTTLDRLVRDGLVTVDNDADGGAGGGQPQKVYAITAAGREELGAWWRAVPSEDPPPRDELMLKVLMAIDHAAHAPEQAEPTERLERIEHALEVITHHRTALTAMLQEHRRRRRAFGDPQSLARTLVAEALVVRAEADLRWLDLCEDRLTRSERRSP